MSIVNISSMAVIRLVQFNSISFLIYLYSRWGITAGHTIKIKMLEKHNMKLIVLPWIIGTLSG